MRSPDGRFHAFRGRGLVRNADGSVAWEESWQLNSFADEGEAEVLSILFLGSQAPRATYYLMALSSAATSTTTLASMSELSGSGYSRQGIAAGDWGSISGSQPAEITAAAKTFGPGVGSPWAPIVSVGLGTAPSGTSGLFILSVPLTGATTINPGQSFEYTLTTSMT